MGYQNWKIQFPLIKALFLLPSEELDDANPVVSPVIPKKMFGSNAQRCYQKRPDEFYQLALAPFATWGCVHITQGVPGQQHGVVLYTNKRKACPKKAIWYITYKILLHSSSSVITVLGPKPLSTCPNIQSSPKVAKTLNPMDAFHAIPLGKEMSPAQDSNTLNRCC